MKFPGPYILVGGLLTLLAFVVCTKKEAEVPPAPTSQPAEVPQANAPAQPAPAAQIANVQQVTANWDAVSKEIANQNYENAVRAWVALDQAQRQAQMTEALRQEYDRRFFQAQEALRQKAETDAKAREAYQAMSRAILRR